MSKTYYIHSVVQAGEANYAIESVVIPFNAELVATICKLVGLLEEHNLSEVRMFANCDFYSEPLGDPEVDFEICDEHPLPDATPERVELVELVVEGKNYVRWHAVPKHAEPRDYVASYNMSLAVLEASLAEEEP